MDITAVIKELLFGHDCVIVPGFGGFIGNYTPARIDKDSATLYPPLKQISFNRNLNHNDGLLVGKISASSSMNYGDARLMVEEFVNELRSKLEKGDKVVFDQIGSFTNNQEGNIQFEPDRDTNYYLDSYGLESFQYLPLEGYDVRKRILPRNVKDPVKRASIRKFIWRAAVIVPLLSVLMAVSLKTDMFKGKVESTTLNPLVNTELEHIKNDIDNNITEVPVNKEITADPAVAETVVPEEVIIPAVEKENYSIITGSFKMEENARTQADMLRADGFNPEIFLAPNGFFRVRAMTTVDLNSAILKKDSITGKYPGSWVSRIY